MTLSVLLCSAALHAQATLPTMQGDPQGYPEVARLGLSSYCNPYFGFRLKLPPAFKYETAFVPVQPPGRHLLLDLHLQRLDRSADLLISAFEDKIENPAHVAASARALAARSKGLDVSGPSSVSVQGHTFERLIIHGDALNSGDESNFYFAERGYVLHAVVFSYSKELSDAIEESITHMEFPSEGGCQAESAALGERTYYGPALPTNLVEETIRQTPGHSVPPGRLAGHVFTDAPLGIRVELPTGWRSLPNVEAAQVIELMRDPTSDNELRDRRRALFRACAGVVFAAHDPRTELLIGVHPIMAVAAMPAGCVPDLVLPSASDPPSASADFSVALARSLGVQWLARGVPQPDAGGHPGFRLDGTLPYHVPGEQLARRLSLRVSVAAHGPWLIFTFSALPAPAGQRELESHIHCTTPAAPAK